MLVLRVTLVVVLASLTRWDAAAQAPGTYTIKDDVSLGFLRLRQGPGTTHAIVAEVPAGTKVKVLECRPGENAKQLPWCRAQVDGKEGWLSSCCIAAADNTASPSAAATQTAPRLPSTGNDALDFWREEAVRQGRLNPPLPLDPGAPYDPGNQPTYVSSLDAYKKTLESFAECLALEALEALKKRVPPSDFARMAESVCYETERKVKGAAADFAIIARLPMPRANSVAEDSVRDYRRRSASVYTQYFYKERPKTEATKQTDEPKLSSGSGFVVSRTGHILTNAHVVDGCSKISVCMQGELNVAASIVALNKEDDLAILKSPIVDKPFAPFRTTPVRAGEVVVAFGFPLQSLLSSSGNVSTGNVTALAGILDNSRQLQVSAPVQPGNSGGPLLDDRGNVIGVVVGKLGMRAASLLKDIPQNVNFAVKASVATAFLDAHGVPYSFQAAEKPLSTPDIGDKAKSFTGHVICER